jgi:hypothetical protein
MTLLAFVFHNSFARKLRAQSEPLRPWPRCGHAKSEEHLLFIPSAPAGLRAAFFLLLYQPHRPSSFLLTEMVFVLTIVVVAAQSLGRCRDRLHGAAA